MLNAAKCCNNARRMLSLSSTDILEDVDFDLVDIEDVPIGKSFRVTVAARNRSRETRTVKILLTTFSVYYTGNKGRHILRTSGVFSLRANQRECHAKPYVKFY